jgi:signal transduction histidine kinase
MSAQVPQELQSFGAEANADQALSRALARPPERSGRQRSLIYLFKIAGLTGVYFAAGKLGLLYATVGQSVTLVWAPTGIALACLLLYGPRLWPAIALGAFLVNATTPGVPVLAALGMAIGNTLEALLGVYLLYRFGFKNAMDRLRDVLLLMALAAGVSTLVSATLGTASLRLGGVIDNSEIANAWRVWWFGDLMGDLIVAPLWLAWQTHVKGRKRTYRITEAFVLAAVLSLATATAFGMLPLSNSWLLEHPYIVFPALIWAALRFQLRGAASANLIIASITVWATVDGRGPFIGATLNESLLQLQVFMAVVAFTSLVLGAATAERQRALQLRDEFMSMASHELRTPLTPLKLQLHLLRRHAQNQAIPSDELTSKFEQVDKQLERIVKLVDELLDVSRVSAGRLSLQPEEIELVTLVRETVDGFKAQLEQTNSAVEIVAEHPVHGIWDRLRLQQVVSNLLTNAMKYGNGKPIRISVHSSKHSATVVMRDEGIGIPEEHQGIIFEAFERGSYQAGTGGLGLGLYIVRRIVEAHQGSIRVDSKPGLGSSFVVELPLKGSKQVAPG